MGAGPVSYTHLDVYKRQFHTSTVIAIHGVTPPQIRFETMNSHYCLLAPSSPVAADVPVTVMEQAA